MSEILPAFYFQITVNILLVFYASRKCVIGVHPPFWLKSELLLQSNCHCAPVCRLQQVCVHTVLLSCRNLTQKLAMKGICCHSPHQVSNPFLRIAAAEHSGRFWRVSNCFSLTDQGTLFQDYDNPSPRDSTVYRCN